MKLALRMLGLVVSLSLVSACRAMPDSEPEVGPKPVSAAPEISQTTGFQAWLARFRAEAAAAGISHPTLDRAFAGVSPNPRVIELAFRQPEFSQPIWDYLATAVSPGRIVTGRRLLARHNDLLSGVSRRYGVQPQYLVAIWGMESSYGRNFGDFNVIESLATLAYQGRRQDFGREQLLAALKILDSGDIPPEQMRGSWAGAMGHAQFIPTTFLNYAVDYDGDARRDLWHSLPDVFASTANYLSRAGWRPDQPWGMEVRLPEGFDWDLADLEVRKPVADWTALGVRRVAGDSLPELTAQGSIILPAGHQGPAFLVLDNFRAILRYNNSISYALAVAHLADRITGAGPFLASWPIWQRPLARSERLELQRLLAQHGYDPGGVDGIIGPKTRSAVKAFQRQINLPGDGYPNGELLEQLRAVVN